MPDITMCTGGKCKLKKTCYRFLAKPDKWQSYFSEPPFKGKSCEYEWLVEPKKEKKC